MCLITFRNRGLSDLVNRLHAPQTHAWSLCLFSFLKYCLKPLFSFKRDIWSEFYKNKPNILRFRSKRIYYSWDIWSTSLWLEIWNYVLASSRTLFSTPFSFSWFSFSHKSHLEKTQTGKGWGGGGPVKLRCRSREMLALCKPSLGGVLFLHIVLSALLRAPEFFKLVNGRGAVERGSCDLFWDAFNIKRRLLD